MQTKTDLTSAIPIPSKRLKLFPEQTYQSRHGETKQTSKMFTLVVFTGFPLVFSITSEKNPKLPKSSFLELGKSYTAKGSEVEALSFWRYNIDMRSPASVEQAHNVKYIT